MASFRDIAEYFDGSLELPVAGKVYRIPPLSARDGLWAQTTMEIAVRDAAQSAAKRQGIDVEDVDLTEEELDQLSLDDDEERDFNRRMLGPVYQEMVDDGVSWPVLKRAAETAYLYFTAGEDAALKRWEDVEGKAMPSTPAAVASSRAATSTKTASRSGSRSPRTSAARRRAAR